MARALATAFKAWPKLKKLAFNGPFSPDDLLSICHNIRQDTVLKWSGYLVEGSWADILDILKQHGPQNIEFHDEGSDQECGRLSMDWTVRCFILGIPWGSQEGYQGAAMAYIRDRTGLVSNPFKEWAAGRLQIPHNWEAQLRELQMNHDRFDYSTSMTAGGSLVQTW
jgi:hypothetical protein